MLAYSYSTGAGNGGVDFRPQRDLYAAVTYIAENSDYFGVAMDDYAMFGFSAGANLVSTFHTLPMAEACGYDYASIAKPTLLVLSYPWLNLEKPDHTLLRGIQYVAGEALESEKVSLLCPYQNLDGSYPAVYLWWSKDDKLVLPEDNELLMVEALEKNKVPFRASVYEGLEHGGGLNKGTVAEGWFDEALEFWNSLKQK